MSEWYYTINGAKKGPVAVEALKNLFTEGTVNNDTLIWRNGFGSSWKKMGEVEELSDHAEPPPVPTSAINNTWIWMLAVVPLLGYCFEEVLSESYGPLPDKAVLIGYFIANITFIILDQKKVEASGRSGISSFFGALLVPFYIFTRNKRIGTNQTTLFVWIAGFLLATFGATGFTMPYLGLTTPTCNSAISVSQIKKIFPDIPINLANLGASDVKDIKHISKSGKIETCSATVLTTSGVSVPISYTIEDRGGEYLWYVQLGS
ncbi:hypothetical protein FHR76_002189 [Rhizobium sp. RAS22]|nr:hypothetical protein [Rhizobium sp. RAS22]